MPEIGDSNEVWKASRDARLFAEEIKIRERVAEWRAYLIRRWAERRTA